MRRIQRCEMSGVRYHKISFSDKNLQPYTKSAACGLPALLRFLHIIRYLYIYITKQPLLQLTSRSLDLLVEIYHLDSAESAVIALVACLCSGSFDSLLNIFCSNYAKHYRNA